jgi:radical SAM superfamily enzyme YgiQ (UPF0313 family)
MNLRTGGAVNSKSEPVLDPGIFQVGGRSGKTIDEIVEEMAASARDISYKELNEKSNRLAHLLRAKGVKRGTIVGLLLDPSFDMTAALVGIWKSGAACLPIDPGIPKRQVVTMLEEARASVLLTDSRTAGKKSFTALQRLRLADRTIPHITAPRPAIKDFNGMPLPDRSRVDYEKYANHIGLALVKSCITMQATRGCPYKCAYCHKIWPKTHTVRSAENIFSEVKRYYDMGIRRFAFIDDIFNLDIKNSSRFFELVIKNNLDLHLLFPSGLRGDILTRDYIDLLVEAGTINMGLALETASPRLQKMIRKNMNLVKLREIAEYICSRYPQVILDLFSMHGFPSETEEEAYMTLDFIKSLKWTHFPFVFNLKIYPNTDMEKLALDHGISYDAILDSEDSLFYQLSSGGPFEKSFTLKYQADFLNNYFLNKERLLHVLPFQMKVLTEDEIAKKYNSYLPVEINSLDDLLQFVNITPQELGARDCLEEEKITVPHLNEKIRKSFPIFQPDPDALRVLLLDVSLNFTDKDHHLYDLVEAPLGLMNLLTYLNQAFGSQINGKIAKSKIDFDSFEELRQLIDAFGPEVIGIRSLSTYRDLFHAAITAIRDFGIDVPIIAGGPYGTSTHEVMLQDPNIDLVVMGEGEMTFNEVIGKILENNHRLPGEEVLRGIKGIAFIEKKKKRPPLSTHNPLREIIFWDQYNHSLDRQPVEKPTPVHTPTDLACVSIIYPPDPSTGTKPRGIMVDHQTLLDCIAGGCGWSDSRALLRLSETAASKQKPADLESQETFWQKELEGETPRLNLTTDFQPLPGENTEGSKLTFEMGEQETRALKELALKRAVDMHSVLLAVYYVLLFKLTRQEDIIVGVPMPTQKHVTLRQVLGPFVTTLPLRGYPTEEKTFDAFLMDIHRRKTAARKNRDYPIETLPGVAGKKCFDTLFAYQTTAVETGQLSADRLDELKAMPYGYDTRYSPALLVFTAVEAANRLFFSVLYRVKRLKEETVQRYIDYFKEIAAAVSKNETLRLKDISISHDYLEPESNLILEADGDFGF